MIRHSLFAFSALLALTYVAAAEPVDGSRYYYCVKGKLDFAKEKGVVPNLRQIRTLCLQGAGDSVVVRPVEGGNPEIKRNFCAAYTQDALDVGGYGAQYYNLTGPRYSPYQEDHMNWCMSVPAKVADAERYARSTEVNAYQFCVDYAAAALEHHKKKETCAVPPTGPNWHVVSYDVHFDWCRSRVVDKQGGGSNEVIRTWSGRYNDLEACGAK
jgi:hypothetical protein